MESCQDGENQDGTAESGVQKIEVAPAESGSDPDAGNGAADAEAPADEKAEEGQPEPGAEADGAKDEGENKGEAEPAAKGDAAEGDIADVAEEAVAE